MANAFDEVYGGGAAKQPAESVGMGNAFDEAYGESASRGGLPASLMSTAPSVQLPEKIPWDAPYSRGGDDDSLAYNERLLRKRNAIGIEWTAEDDAALLALPPDSQIEIARDRASSEIVQGGIRGAASPEAVQRASGVSPDSAMGRIMELSRLQSGASLVLRRVNEAARRTALEGGDPAGATKAILTSIDPAEHGAVILPTKAYQESFNKIHDHYKKQKPMYDLAKRVVDVETRNRNLSAVDWLVWLARQAASVTTPSLNISAIDPGKVLQSLSPENRELLIGFIGELSSTPRERSWPIKVLENIARGAEDYVFALPDFFRTSLGSESDRQLAYDATKLRQAYYSGDIITGDNMFSQGLYDVARMAPTVTASAVAGGPVRATLAVWWPLGTQELYYSARDAGVSDAVARPWSVALGLAHGAVETLQLSQMGLIKSAGTRVKTEALKSIWTFLWSELKKAPAKWGKEMMEEGLQGAIQIGNEAITRSLEADAPGIDWAARIKGLGDELKQAALPLAYMMIAGGATTMRSSYKVQKNQNILAGAIVDACGISKGAALAAIDRAVKRKGKFTENLERELTDELQVSPQGLEVWAGENPEKGRTLADKEKPTRKDFEAAGLPRRTGKQRMEIAGTLGEVIPLIEAREAEAAVQVEDAEAARTKSPDLGTKSESVETAPIETLRREVPDAQEVGPRTEDEGQAGDFAAEHGVNAVFVETADEKFQGRRSGDTIFVRSGMPADLIWETAAHEAAHATGMDAILGKYAEDAALADARQRTLDRADQEYRAVLEKDSERLNREAVALLVGEVMRDPTARARLQKSNPTLFARIMDTIRKAITSLRGESNFADRVLAEFEAAEGEAVDVAKARQPKSKGKKIKVEAKPAKKKGRKVKPDKLALAAEKPKVKSKGLKAKKRPPGKLKRPLVKKKAVAKPAESQIEVNETLRERNKETPDHIVAPITGGATIRKIGGKTKTELGADDAKALVTKNLKQFLETTPEFAIDPTFTVDKDSNLVFRDGYKFTFAPDTFGIETESVEAGETVRVPLEGFGIDAAKYIKRAETIAKKGFPQRKPTANPFAPLGRVSSVSKIAADIVTEGGAEATLPKSSPAKLSTTTNPIPTAGKYVTNGYLAVPASLHKNIGKEVMSDGETSGKRHEAHIDEWIAEIKNAEVIEPVEWAQDRDGDNYVLFDIGGNKYGVRLQDYGFIVNRLGLQIGSRSGMKPKIPNTLPVLDGEGKIVGVVISTPLATYQEAGPVKVFTIAKPKKKAKKKADISEPRVDKGVMEALDDIEEDTDADDVAMGFAPRAPDDTGGTGREDAGADASMRPRRLVQAADVIRAIKRLWPGLSVRGKATFRKKYPAWYDPALGEMRLQDVRNIDHAMHELGHHFDQQLGKWSKTKGLPAGLPSELIALGRALYGDKRPPGGYRSEGFAEFIRGYLMGSDMADKSPLLHRWFTTEYLQNNPAEARKLRDLEGLVSRLQARMPEQVVRAFHQPLRTDWSPDRIAAIAITNIENKLIDVNLPLLRTMQATGADLSELNPADFPYILATYYSRAEAGRIHHAVLDATTDLCGRETGAGLREALSPVMEMGGDALNEWIDYAIARKSIILHSRGIQSGISPEASQAVVNKYESADFDAVLDNVTAWSRRILHLLVDSGAMTEAEFAKIEELNPVYIPFARQFAEGELNKGRKGGGRGVHRFTKKGSAREIHDPIIALIAQGEKIIQTAQSADVVRALIEFYDAQKGKAPAVGRMLSEVPAPTEATTFAAEQIKKQMAEKAVELGADEAEVAAALLDAWEGQITIFSKATEYHGKDNVISIVIDGKRRFFEVEPELMAILDNMSKKHTDWGKLQLVGKMSRAAVRLQRMGATGLNAAFGFLRNPIRDTGMASVTSDYHFHIPGISTLHGMILDWINSDWARLYYGAGLPLAGRVGQNLQARSLRHMRRKATSAGWFRRMWSRGVIDGITEILSHSEIGPRLMEFRGAYKHGMKKWGNERDALVLGGAASKDITTNFTRAGSAGRAINEVVLFFNAGIQGPEKLLRSLGARAPMPWAKYQSRGKNAARTLARAAAWMTTAAMLLYLRHRDEEWWKELPSYEKWNYLHVKLFEDSTPIRLPLPFEAGSVFAALPVAMFENARSPGAFKEALGQAAENASPLNLGSLHGLARNIALISPVADVLANEDWTGRPIVQRHIDETKEPADQYGPYTSGPAKAIGRSIGYSPSRIEHLLNGYTGGLYRRLAAAIRVATSPSAISADDPSGIPVLGTLFTRPGTSRVTGDFYDRLDALVRRKGSGKASLAEIGELAASGRLSRSLSGLWAHRREALDASTSASKTKTEMAGLLDDIQTKIRKHQALGNADHRNTGTAVLAYAATAPTPLKETPKQTKRRLRAVAEAERLLPGTSIDDIISALRSEYRRRSKSKKPLRISTGSGKLTAYGKRLRRLRQLRIE